MSQYLTEIKILVDHILAVKSTVHEDIIIYTLNGLPTQYQSFKTFIRSNLNPITLDDFYSFLISEEINHLTDSTKAQLTTNPSYALFSNRGRSSRSRERASANNNP